MQIPGPLSIPGESYWPGNMHFSKFSNSFLYIIKFKGHCNRDPSDLTSLLAGQQIYTSRIYRSEFEVIAMRLADHKEEFNELV